MPVERNSDKAANLQAHQPAGQPSGQPIGQLVDPFGRSVDYIRLSVTDRCDFRCVYCMAEQMTFLPKKDLLTLEELEEVCRTFAEMGTRRIRLTGGEPLVRRDILSLIRNLGAMVRAGQLDEVTLTTNGSQLEKMAEDLAAAGVRRLNISIDSLDPDRFRQITRWGELDRVLAGMRAAVQAGLKLKLNVVALKGVNEEELLDMVLWAGDQGHDITLIEVMPMGALGEVSRLDQYLPLSVVRARLAKQLTLTDSRYQTGGPARYVTVQETGGRLGFITPMTHNFCESCNRVRLTCTGQLYMCLGQDDTADLATALRSGGPEGLRAAIVEAISRKPKGHDFVISRHQPEQAVARHMNVTGG
jgi:cyclic pyranopterin phosphate synthase